MQTFVHFAVGVACAVLLLTGFDLPPRIEFLLAFASGVWANLPDGYWLLVEFGWDSGVDELRSIHDTSWMNVFWFHHLIDELETSRPNLEAGIAMAVMLVAVGVFYALNDWSVG